jgi:signal peptidase I
MKPKKRLLIIVIIAAMIGLYMVANVTGILRLYKVSTTSGRPAMEVGDHVWISKLAKPKRYDLIVFNHYDSMAEKKQFLAHRLCGMPGDTVEIKNGDLYVNKQSTIGLFDLCVPYTASPQDGIKANNLLNLSDDAFFIYSDESKAQLNLDNKQAEQIKKLNIAIERLIIPAVEKNYYINRMYGQPWNIDHFGPIVIPADRYFVLGDNRHRSQDSRYIGLVPIDDFYGTVLGK